MTSTRILAAAVFGFALMSEAPPVKAEESDFSIGIKDHHFDPVELTIPAGKKVRLLVRNLDPTPEEFESIELHREKVIPANGEGIVFIGPLQPGTYEFFGDFNPQTARGHIIAKEEAK